MTEISETTDIEQIQKLAEKCYMDAYKNIHTEEQNRFSFNEMYSPSSLEYQIKDLKSRFFILNRNGIDLAYISMYPIAKGQWMLDKLYVLPDCKGLGYGRTLVGHVIKNIQEIEKSSFKIMLKVNRRNEAVSFYKHLGFEITESWDHVIAEGKWVMDGYDMELLVKAKQIDYSSKQSSV